MEKTISKKGLNKLYGYNNKPFIPNDKNIELLEKNLNISLYEWQVDFLKGNNCINKNRASGKTYIFVLSYTLGLMEIYTLQKLETDLSNVIRKVDTLHYIQKINKDIIKKLKDVEERNFTLYEL